MRLILYISQKSKLLLFMFCLVLQLLQQEGQSSTINYSIIVLTLFEKAQFHFKVLISCMFLRFFLLYLLPQHFHCSWAQTQTMFWFLVFSFHLGGISWQLVRFASFFPIGGGFGSLEPFWKLKLIKICILAPVAKTLQGRESSVDFYEGVIISTNLSCVLFSICPAPPHLLRHLPGVLIGRTIFNA